MQLNPSRQLVSIFLPVLICAGLIVLVFGLLSPAQAATHIAPQPGPVFTVTNLTDVVAGCNVGDCSLRSAIQAAIDQAGANSILFSVAGTIPLGSQLPQVTDALVISGPAGGITIDGVGAVRLFSVSPTGALTLYNLTLTNGNADNGGAIYVQGWLTATLCTISHNNATDMGGAIYGAATAIQINSSSLENNHAGDNGGSIYLNTGTARLQNSLCANNTAKSGGCIHMYIGYPHLIIENSTIYSNSVVDYGGGIQVASGYLTATHTTFANNFHGAGFAGSAYRLASNGYSKFAYIRNSLFYNNNGTPCSSDGIVYDQGGNMKFPNTNCPGIFANANLGAIQSNGGPTRTMAVPAGSPALDRALALYCLATDQRGEPRPDDGDGDGLPKCDTGAYEYINPLEYLFLPHIVHFLILQ